MAERTVGVSATGSSKCLANPVGDGVVHQSVNPDRRQPESDRGEQAHQPSLESALSSLLLDRAGGIPCGNCGHFAFPLDPPLPQTRRRVVRQ